MPLLYIDSDRRILAVLHEDITVGADGIPRLPSGDRMIKGCESKPIETADVDAETATEYKRQMWRAYIADQPLPALYITTAGKLTTTKPRRTT